MGKYSLSDFTNGTCLSKDLYSEKGELLLTGGTILTDSHLNLLRKRNIFVVYTHEVCETTSNHNDCASIDPKESLSGSSLRFDTTDSKPDKNKVELPPEFEQIRNRTLEQLIRTPVTLELDKELRRGLLSDRPVGVAVKTALSQLLPSQRDSAYKEGIASIYLDTISLLQGFSEKILSGESSNILPIREQVELLLKIMLKDRSILLSLAYVKTLGESFIYNHSLNVCILSMNIATALGYNKRQVVLVGMGALLHDIGMFLVPDSIRENNSTLSAEDFREIQKHPVTGLHLLGKIRHLPDPVRFMIYQSHEREDGSGYPRHSRGKRIHGFARIIQTADIFEALTAPRNYRQAYTPFEAMEMLIRMTQKGQIALPVVRALLSYVSLFPVGSIVELSDHRLARIIQANSAVPDRPLVSILTDEEFGLLKRECIYQCDLSVTRNVSIIRAFSATYLSEIDLLDGF